MSQPRMRKASAAGEVSRVRSTFVKSSGDSTLNPKRQQHPRSRSKNKIPRNLRYDLDNALVGLCDVWFEDIKPHLIRNNIKVHIHGDGASPASGDYKRVPPGAPGCSHYDPGAASDHHQHQSVNFADCYSTPPTASKAPCRKPPAQASPTSPLQLILQSLNQHQRYKNTKSHPENTVANTKSQKTPVRPLTEEKWHPWFTQPHFTSAKSRTESYYRSVRTRERGSQTYFRRSLDPRIVMVDQSTQTKRPIRRHASARVSSNVPAASFDRCPGKTTLLPRKLKHRQSSPPLLTDSRNKKIKEQQKVNKNEIEVLYYSPNSSRFNSSVTLLETPKGKRKRKGSGKIPPWR
ncbi:uncharacterized protein LOC106137792 [Amyelois transitella]|uniref:uncharacterized protein LOC106137792 n=1 Tax=Amyelois transitella TaxID=680683 RepID=UPI00298F88BB|nr:uncharacterized protein LOC106137792 [Amyelois transitella]